MGTTPVTVALIERVPIQALREGYLLVDVMGGELSCSVMLPNRSWR